MKERIRYKTRIRAATVARDPDVCAPATIPAEYGESVTNGRRVMDSHGYAIFADMQAEDSASRAS